VNLYKSLPKFKNSPTILRHVQNDEQSSLNIVFEDESVIVIDKPEGLLTIATANE